MVVEGALPVFVRRKSVIQKSTLPRLFADEFPSSQRGIARRAGIPIAHVLAGAGKAKERLLCEFLFDGRIWRARGIAWRNINNGPLNPIVAREYAATVNEYRAAGGNPRCVGACTECLWDLVVLHDRILLSCNSSARNSSRQNDAVRVWLRRVPRRMSSPGAQAWQNYEA